VTWVNLDDDDHTATGNDFDTGVIRPGELHTILFNEPGSFAYSCQIHPVMVGRVEVRDASGSVPASPVATRQATPASARPDNSAVTIVNLSFEPPQLEITVGTSVRWTNEDPLPHTATATGGEFDSGILDKGASFSHTFDAPGTYEYICAIHPNMKGSISVTD
jgi:plastocyanin